MATKCLWFRHYLVAAFAAASVVMSANTVQAQLIAADGFNQEDYDPDQFGDVQFSQSGPFGDGNPVVSPGWVDDGDGDPSPWNSGTGNLGADFDANPDLASLNNGNVNYDDDSTGKGKFVSLPNGGFGVPFRAANRNLDSYTAADTYYMSALLNPASAFSGGGEREHAMVGFTNSGWDSAGFTNSGGATTPFGLMFGFHGEQADSNPAAADQVDLVVRARQGDVSNPILVDTVLLAGDTEAPLDNNTYLVMLKLEVNKDGGAFDEVTYWVNPTSLSSEATATTSSLATGSFNTLAMDQNDRIDRTQIVINNWTGARGFFFDELRLAYDFESLRGELTALPGDFNADGTVDAADYTVWRRDGLPESDYNLWRANYGTTAGAAASVASVPEPTSLLLVICGLLIPCCQRKRVR